MVDARTTIPRRTWRTALSLYKNLKETNTRGPSTSPERIQWPDPRMFVKILEQLIVDKKAVFFNKRGEKNKVMMSKMIVVNLSNNFSLEL